MCDGEGDGDGNGTCTHYTMVERFTVFDCVDRFLELQPHDGVGEWVSEWMSWMKRKPFQLCVWVWVHSSFQHSAWCWRCRFCGCCFCWPDFLFPPHSSISKWISFFIFFATLFGLIVAATVFSWLLVLVNLCSPIPFQFVNWN